MNPVEQTIRSSLAEHASEVHLPKTLIASAQSLSQRRRRTRLSLAATAGLAVLAVGILAVAPLIPHLASTPSAQADPGAGSPPVATDLPPFTVEVTKKNMGGDIVVTCVVVQFQSGLRAQADCRNLANSSNSDSDLSSRRVVLRPGEGQVTLVTGVLDTSGAVTFSEENGTRVLAKAVKLDGYPLTVVAANLGSHNPVYVTYTRDGQTVTAPFPMQPSRTAAPGE